MSVSLISAVPKDHIVQNERPINYELGSANVILADLHHNIIIPGDSASDVAAKIDEQRKRDVAARESQARAKVQKIKPSPSYESAEGYQVIGSSKEQCVVYAKRMSGISRPIGYAGSARADGANVQVGAIGLMKGWGHAVYIEAVNGNQVTVSESNWIKGKIIRRTLALSDFRGYIYK